MEPTVYYNTNSTREPLGAYTLCAVPTAQVYSYDAAVGCHFAMRTVALSTLPNPGCAWA